MGYLKIDPQKQPNPKTKGKKITEKSEHLWDNINQSNTSVTGDPEEASREMERTEIKSEDIMARNLQNGSKNELEI